MLVGIGTTVLWIQGFPGTSRALPPPVVSQAEEPAEHRTPQDVEALRAEVERLKTGKENLERRSEAMRSELVTLRAQFIQMNRDQEAIGRKMQKITRGGRAGGKAADAPARTPEEEPAEEAHAHAEAQIQAQTEVFEGIMLMEKTDPEWARAAQQTLHEAFHSEAMVGLHLVQVDCRTSLCRLDLSLDGSMTPEEAFHRLMHSDFWQGQSFVRIDGEPAEVVVYLSREGYALPQSSE
jgi:hypothetical protein